MTTDLGRPKMMKKKNKKKKTEKLGNGSACVCKPRISVDGDETDQLAKIDIRRSLQRGLLP